MKEFTIEWLTDMGGMRDFYTCVCEELDEAIDAFADEAIGAMEQALEDFEECEDIDFLECEGIIFNSDNFDDEEIGRLIVTSDGGYDFMPKIM